MMNRLLEPKMKMNDLDHCLEVVLMSRQLLSHICHWISRKPLQRTFLSFQRTTNRKWPTGDRMVTWPMTSRNPERSSHDPNTLKAQSLENTMEMLFSKQSLITN